MPRKAKAELAAEREEQEREHMEIGEMAMESTTVEEPAENRDAVSDALADKENPLGSPGEEAEQQKNAISGLLAGYSETAENCPAPESDDRPEFGSEDDEPDAEDGPDEDDAEQAADPTKAADPPSADSGEAAGLDITNLQDSGDPAVDDTSEEVMPAEDAQSAEPARPVGPSSNALRRPSFFQTNFRELDRDLSAEQMQEWNSIYASYRSKSVLTGTVIGVDDNRFDVTNPQTGLAERRTVRSLVIVGYRVKVLIPESEVWAPGEERPDYVMRGMVGAKIDYVVMQVDREGECAIASRRSALAKQRRHFMAARGGHEPGEALGCNVLVVGPRRVLVECGGYDITLSQRDLSWTAISDLRQEYRPGQELPCKLKEFSAREGKLSISVRDVTPNPFIGAENRHPIGSRRQAVISGKYAGGVFCRLPDGVTVLCLYSNLLGDDEFLPGDGVLIHITQYDYRRQLIYGRIISKW